MKSMMLSWEYPPNISGGLGQHVKEIVPELLAADRDLVIHMVAPSPGGASSTTVDGNLVVHRVAVPAARQTAYFEDVRLANELLAEAAQAVSREHGPFDLIHVHDWLMGWTAYAVQDASGAPILATLHATERGRYRGSLHDSLSVAIDGAEDELANRARRVITCSRAMQEEVESYFEVDPRLITVIPNGIAAHRMARLHSADLGEFRERYALPGERIVFNIGRLVYEKGADLLVETVPLVLQRIPNARFVIGGQGPLWPGLQQRVEELRLQERVMLTGFLSDDERDKLYAVSDCCVFPSRYEPFGIVALEAMAAGTPVVVANVGGLGTVVEHDVTGLTAYSEDIASLAWAIIKTLDDPEGAATRAESALVQIEECFSWHVVAAMTLRVYRTLVKETQ